MKHILFILLFFSNMALFAQNRSNYAKDWLLADSFANKGLSESAKAEVEKIYAKAKAEQNADQQVKALIHIMKFFSYREEDAQAKLIEWLQAEIAKAEMPVKPLLQSMLAEMYWSYYEENRYQFYNRTTVVDFVQTDLRTWSLPQLVAEVQKLYLVSLENSEALDNVFLDKNFDEILTSEGKKWENINLRPALLDLLAHRAIDFLMNTEPDITRPAYAFVLDKAEYFDPAEKFKDMSLVHKDSSSMKLQALRILQSLIKLHTTDRNTLAVLDADLKRIRLVYEQSVLANKNDLYLKALEALEYKNKHLSASADVSYQIALYWYEQGKDAAPTDKGKRFLLQKAYQIAENIVKKYPESAAVPNCMNLMKVISNKELSISVEKLNPSLRASRAFIAFRNLKMLHFRVVKTNRMELQSLARYYYDNDKQSKAWKSFVLKKPEQAWKINLPSDEGDYLNHSVEMKIPELSHGTYALLASESASFSADSTIAYTPFQVSDLAFIQRNDSLGAAEFFVMHRNSGEPLANVKVNAYKKEYNYNKEIYEYKLLKTYTSDKKGYVRIPSWRTDYGSYFVAEFVRGLDIVSSEQDIYAYEKQDENAPSYNQSFFFTDRSIYRPGQTVYFKGVLLHYQNKKYEILPRTKVTVILSDPNYKQVGTQELETNEYGTFNGTFTMPIGKVTGQMRLQVMNIAGDKMILLEEYKRPKFEVNFEKAQGTPKLGEKVTVKGMAKAFSGASIDKADVNYRIKRKMNQNSWYFLPDGNGAKSPEVEISSGKMQTNEKGEFSIDFDALPDLSIDKKTQPIFIYSISVDVTDINGETRSATKDIRLSYRAIEILTKVPEYINLDTKIQNVEIQTLNLEGQKEAVKGNYVIYALKSPEGAYRNRFWAVPDLKLMSKNEFYATFPIDPFDQEDNWKTWEKSDAVQQRTIDTQNAELIDLKVLKAGAYVIKTTVQDKFGETVQSIQYFTVYSAASNNLPYPSMDFYVAPESSVEVGQTAKIVLGTSAKAQKVLFEVELDKKIIEQQWIVISQGTKVLEIPIKAEYKGGIGVHLNYINENRIYSHTARIDVPHSDRKLDISFETFRDKLLPGQEEEWKIKIKGAKADKVMAEMVATMYDASLDAFAVNAFDFPILSENTVDKYWKALDNFTDVSNRFWKPWGNESLNNRSRTYEQLNWFGFSFGRPYYYRMGSVDRAVSRSSADMDMVTMSAPAPEEPQKTRSKNGHSKSKKMQLDKSADGRTESEEAQIMAMPEALEVADEQEISDKVEIEGIDYLAKGKAMDLSQVKARTNFNETAFFFPLLQTDSEGNVVIKFKVPESLTKWKMLGFAHTQDLKFGLVENSLITQKDLMVVPNAPRFFRENDEMIFSVKITNLSANDLEGEAKLDFSNAINATLITDKILKSINGNTSQQSFKIQKGNSVSLQWSIKIPDANVQALNYKIVAAADKFSDGEENVVPVLTNRMLVTETLPLWTRNGELKTFELKKLMNNSSSTLRNEKLTLEVTSNPAWYAVQALPYLIEYPYECAEQTFSRFYANSLAAHIAHSSPKIKAVFDSWKSTNSQELLSNLEKNPELKQILLEETPWVRNSTSESERKKRIALLFDFNKMSEELERALTKLEKMQKSNGGFPWFDGMEESRWITQHIACGLGHLDKLKVRTVRPQASASNPNENAVDPQRTWDMLQKAVTYLDKEIRNDYEELKKQESKGLLKMTDKQIGGTQIHYLYMRSFFADIPLNARNQEAHDYFLGQGEKYWLGFGNYQEGMIALALHRKGKGKVGTDIVKSLKERALRSEEMGMYWKNMSNGGFWWYEMPIETQALMIETFAEITKDSASVNDLKTWLLKQKETQDWGTTKSTSEAIYALLLQGDNWLDSEELVEVTVGGTKINPKELEDVKVEAGTGYFKTSWGKEAIKNEMGKVTIVKKDKGIAWGGLYWQYFEQLDKITGAETPLKINKKLFLQQNSDKGLVLKPIDAQTKLKVGDLIKVRIEIRADRAMEYVHLKDMRASGLEPINVISQYKYQDGLGYYESTRDAATNFFIGYLPQGTFVFEYPLRITHEGTFSNGITTMQCMYAPKFSSHSEGVKIEVGK
jgi:uncharacterized protein YfaS (alpha-2-macroglobulin family)